MKQMKRVLAILLAVIMLIGTVPVVSMAAPQYTRLGNSSIGYYLDEEGTLTLQGRGSTPDYDSGDSPFDFRYENDLNIKRVVIKEGITRLGNMLFIGCPMESISLPDSLTSIGNYALYSCDNLSELELPSNLTDYGLQPFGGCDYLEQITFHSSTVTCRFLYFYQAQMSHGLINGLRDTVIRIPLPFTIHETENNKTTVIRSNLQAEEVLLVDEEDNNSVQCLNDCSLVTWKNFDGSTLSLTSAPVGETPVFDGETPQRTTDENHYTFAGWSDGETTYSSDSLPKTVKNKDVVYTAVYSTRPHAYGEPVWTWSEDKLSATAQFVCTDGDCAYQVTKDAVITREMRENKLVSTASVTFNGNTYTNEYEQDFTGGYLLNFAQSEHGTAESDKYYAESGEKVTITFRPDEGYTLEEYSYEYFSADGTSEGGKVTSTTKFYDKTEYELQVHERAGKGYIVITPVFVKTYRIIDNTGGKVYFRRESFGDKTDKGVAGMTIYVTPEDYIYSSQSGGVGKVIEDITVTDDKGQEIEANLYSDARFTMPASDVTVSAVVSDTKYRVETAYEPTGDHGYILSNSKSVLAEGETYEGEVVNYEPYILTGLYAQDSEGNRTDLIANGSYNAETGIVSFTMPAKALTIYREHALHPEYHAIVRDEQSRANASGIGYIARKGASYFGGITGESVVLDVDVYDERYGLSSLYYVDENGEKVDLMPFYNKAENTCTFTMPDSEITLYYTFASKCRLVPGEVEHGTVTIDKEYAVLGEKAMLHFHPDEGYTLSEYRYKYYTANGVYVSGGSFTTGYYDTQDYEITVEERVDVGGYLVITPVFVKTYNIIDNTGGQLHFHRESGDSTHKGIPGMRIYVYPNDFIGYDNGDGEGKVIESITVTDDKGQEIEVELHSDAWFIMPESDVTVSATVSGTKYMVKTDYDPIRDHGIVRSQSSSILSEGETYVGKVESWFPYILTGLYTEDKEGNRTDLMANGSYNAETGIVSFVMPAKTLTIYREHEIHPNYHKINFDAQSSAAAEGYITRYGNNYMGGIAGQDVTLSVEIRNADYGLATLYYIDGDGQKVDLMPNYNKETGEFTFTMPDSEIMLYYTFRECHTVTVNEYENDFSITGFVGDTIDFEIFINDYAKENAKLDETYFFYYDSNNEYQRLDADWNPETGKGTFVMPDEDITLHIQYMYYRDVPVGTFEHGTVTANKEKAIDGEIVTYTVHPEDGWVVTALGQSMSQYSTQGTQDENNSNIWYVTMPWGWSGERKLWATFEKNPDWHTITIHESENGSVSYGRTGADTGDEVTLTATPDSGYVLKNITVTDAQQNTVPVEGTTFTMPASDVTVSAAFVKGEMVEATEPYIDATGAYILGNVKYFAGADGKNYAVNANGTIGEELESVELSYFEFSLLSNDTYQINFYTGPTDTLEELVIPKTFNGKAVTVLGNNGNNALIDYTGKTKTQFSLVLNENITEIKRYTFYTMWVKEVKGDTSRLSTIGDYAFSWANSRGGYAIDISLEYPGTVSVGSEIFNHMIVTARIKHATRLSKSTCGQQSISYAFTDAHTYGEPVWNWAEENTLATASFTCTDTRCNHRETVNADVTHTVKDAVTTHIAIVEFNGNTYTDTVSEGEKANNGVNLTLGGDITSNYYIDYTKYTGAASITYTYNSVNEKEQNVPVTKTIDLSDIPAQLLEGERIKLTVAQAPAQMAETTHIEILNAKGEVMETLNYSAKSYCDSITAMSEEALAAFTDKSAELKQLCHSLIAYAEAAQGVFKDYETTKVTCESDTVKEQIAAANATPSYTLNNAGEIKFTTVSFACTKDARLRFYLNTQGATGTPPAPSASNGNAALKYTDKNGSRVYFIEVSGIDAASFNEKISVSYGGSDIQFSVLDYCGIVLKDGSTASAEIQQLAKTLVVYYENAVAYQ